MNSFTSFWNRSEHRVLSRIQLLSMLMSLLEVIHYVHISTQENYKIRFLRVNRIKWEVFSHIWREGKFKTSIGNERIYQTKSRFKVNIDDNISYIIVWRKSNVFYLKIWVRCIMYLLIIVLPTKLSGLINLMHKLMGN